MYKHREFGLMILRDESSDTGKSQLPTSIFSDFFKNCILMPKRKCCEYPVKHSNSTRVSKGVVFVSTRLSNFLISRYDAPDDKIRWLCPRCHAFEWKEMLTRPSMELSHNDNSSEIEAMSESSSVHDAENDGSMNAELQDVNEEEERTKSANG
ncbi:unnamed protein product [Rotaria socialis]|uniref:Uncharacterized protein n=2 Tax=Rotaria socialis TaxID=392032 RepID=A0A820SL76_9BILA|nr:unnamed protein product [Rotaria socialis]